MIKIPSLTRRKFLISSSSVLATSLILPSISKAGAFEKTLKLYNVHTGEWFKGEFWAEGQYIKESLNKIHHIMRDWRTDEITTMDTKLLELLHTLHQKISANKPFEIISAYRSSRTNSMLREAGNRVAKNSFHLEGKAIDIKMSGTSLLDLRNAAHTLDANGVGYYPASGFIHIDVGYRPHRGKKQARW